MDSKSLNIAGRLGAVAIRTNMIPIISILILLIGVGALLLTPREENPTINVPAANIIVRMQGASPTEVQNLVVRPLEMIMGAMTGVDHTYGAAMGSMGVVTVVFKVGQNKEASLVKLYEHLIHNLDRMPPGASLPLVKPMDVDNVPVSVITLSTPAMSGLSLKQLAERVREQLIPLKGVSVANIIGGRDREVRVELNPARMTAYGITLDQLHRVLSAANSGGPVGHLVGGNRVTKVWLNGYLKSAEDVGRLIVGVTDGRPVYLRDIASIADGPAAVKHYDRIGFGAASKDYGQQEQPAVSITLAKKRGSNAVFVTERIRQKLDNLKGNLIPDNVQVTITRDSGDRANAAVNLLLEHLVVAIASVIIIMLVFLGWREAAIVTMNIPLILFVVLAIGLLAGQTINRITLFALILSLGLLVDDAIVVIENIHRHLHRGAQNMQDKAQLIIHATNETGKPTIVATIAVILAFIPMGFVTGMMGPYMAPIPFNAPIAMAASLLVAYMLTPWITQRWLPCRMLGSTMEEMDDLPTDWVHRTYMKLATPLIERRGPRMAFWLIVLLLFAFALWEPAWQFVRPSGINGPLTAGTIELKMLPKGNENTFNITIDMPEGTTLAETDGVTRQIADVVRANPMVTNYEAYVGQPGPIDFNGMLRGAALFRNSPHQAEIRVNLVNKKERSIQSAQIVLQLRKALKPVIAANPRANIKLVEEPPGPPVRATLLAEIYGPDYATQRAIAAKVRQRFAATYDVTDIDDSIGHAQPQLDIVVNKEKAARLGVETGQVKQVLSDFLAGYNAGPIHIDSSTYPVLLHVQLPMALRATSDDLSRIYVSGKAGPVQLSAIATVERTTAKLPIFSKDSYPVVYVTGETKSGSQVYPLLAMDKHLDGSRIAPGMKLKTGNMRFTDAQPDNTFSYQLLWGGEMRLTLDVFRDLGSAFIVGLLLIYLLLVAYYGEFVLPLLVMAPTALTLIGIFPGHWITGQAFTATSMIGMIALAGIVVRNSLLLIDFILDYRRQGYDVKMAVLEAGAVRARPILLTALAVIAGTSVMISDPVFGGLGVSMAFGTLAATVLTLFIIPMVYYLWQKDRPYLSADVSQCKV